MPTPVTPLSGLTGSLRYGSATVVNIKSWDISRSQDMLAVSAFGTKDKTYIPGLRDASGSFTGEITTNAAMRTVLKLLNSTVATQAAATIDLIISTVAGKKMKWTGSGYVSGDSASDSHDGIVSYSGTLQFSGGARLSTT